METLRFTRPELKGVHLHAVVRGDPRSPCLVMLHGGGANLHWWDEIAPSLAERFRVVCLDFRSPRRAFVPHSAGAAKRHGFNLSDPAAQARVAVVESPR